MESLLRPTVHPDGTYNYTWRGCLGLYESAYGRVSLEDEGVAFFGPAEEGGEGGLSIRFQVVRWGERTYLVPADEIMKLVAHFDVPLKEVEAAE